MNYKRKKLGGGVTKVKHRIVMEQYLKRELLPDEVVHHIDGDKGNNDIDNLQLCANRAEHNKLHATNFCPKGHEYTKENTLFHNNANGKPSRRCRECHRLSEEKRRNTLRQKPKLKTISD